MGEHDPFHCCILLKFLKLQLEGLMVMPHIVEILPVDTG
jgi:hypothetical protein